MFILETMNVKIVCTASGYFSLDFGTLSTVSQQHSCSFFFTSNLLNFLMYYVFLNFISYLYFFLVSFLRNIKVDQHPYHVLHHSRSIQ